MTRLLSDTCIAWANAPDAAAQQQISDRFMATVGPQGRDFHVVGRVGRREFSGDHAAFALDVSRDISLSTVRFAMLAVHPGIPVPGDDPDRTMIRRGSPVFQSLTTMAVGDRILARVTILQTDFGSGYCHYTSRFTELTPRR